MDTAVVCAVYRRVQRSITNAQLYSLSFAQLLPVSVALNAVQPYAVAEVTIEDSVQR